jgi:PhnB protein
VSDAHLKADGFEIVASDWMASHSYEPVLGTMSAVFETGDSYEELQAISESLRDGENNTRLQELHEMPFGIYGQFYDRYGVQWIFTGSTGRQ